MYVYITNKTHYTLELLKWFTKNNTEVRVLYIIKIVSKNISHENINKNYKQL